MTVTTRDGRQWTSQVDDPKGSMGNAMSGSEIRAKFDSLAQPVLGAARAARIAQLVDGIEQCSHVGKLMRLAAKSATGTH